MAPPSPVVVPRQLRRGGRLDALDAVEREVTRTAALGRRALADIAAEPLGD